MSEKVQSQSSLLTPDQLFEAMHDSEISENQEKTTNMAEDGTNGMDTTNPQQNDDDCKLFAGGLAQDATEKDISEYFSKFGKVVYVNLKIDHRTGGSRGWAIVLFQDVDTLSNVLAKEEHIIKDKKVFVQKSLSSKEGKRETCKIPRVGSISDVQKRLFDAICKGNLKHVEFFLKHVTHVAKINAPDETGQSPLFIAAKHGRFEIVEYLHQNGADINAQLNYDRKDISAGWTPLHCAAYYGNLEVVKYLVQNGALLNPGDKKDRTPLYYAIFYHKDDVVKYLKNAGAKEMAKISYKRLFDAICEGDLKTVELCLKNGVRVNAKDELGRSPLYIAAKLGRFEIVKLLLQEGADIHVKSNGGQSVLYIGAYSGNVEIVKLLHQKGADINAKDKKGWSPLHCAAYHGHLDIVKYLIENRAWLNPKDQENKTPLDYAITNYKADDTAKYLKTAVERQEALKRKNLSPKCTKEEIESKKQEALMRRNWLQKRRRTY